MDHQQKPPSWSTSCTKWCYRHDLTPQYRLVHMIHHPNAAGKDTLNHGDNEEVDHGLSQSLIRENFNNDAITMSVMKSPRSADQHWELPGTVWRMKVSTVPACLDLVTANLPDEMTVLFISRSWTLLCYLTGDVSGWLKGHLKRRM